MTKFFAMQKYRLFSNRWCVLVKFTRLPHDFFFFLFLFLLRPQKKEAKKSGFLADMNAARSVHLLTAAAKVNWTLTRFRTPLYETGHSLRVRTACRHSPRTERLGWMLALTNAMQWYNRTIVHDLEEVEF